MVSEDVVIVRIFVIPSSIWIYTLMLDRVRKLRGLVTFFDISLEYLKKIIKK